MSLKIQFDREDLRPLVQLAVAEANTVQKTKELKDLALTAADWAKRKGMGEEAIRYARGFALDAERKMGELLAATERSKGKLKRGPAVPAGNSGKIPQTLAEIGVSRKESSRAQKLANLPEEVFEENGTRRQRLAIV